MHPLKQFDQTEALLKVFPGFNGFPWEERERIKWAWTHKQGNKLVQMGLDSDRSNDDSNSRLSPQ